MLFLVAAGDIEAKSKEERREKFQWISPFEDSTLKM